jgi:hypothetical protein
MAAIDIHFFFTMREQIKLYHWQTESYSRHKATDAALEKLDGLIDSFVEVYIGKYGRPRLTAKTNTVHIQNLNDKTIMKFILNCLKYVSEDLHFQKRDTDLANIRDEMMAELNQLLYLFSLH